MIKEYFINGLKDITISFIDNSYIICLGVAMVSILLYLAGLKKAGKYVTISLVTYILLQACKGLIK
jgi:hypothetical protein